jgi:hypothetical protein
LNGGSLFHISLKNCKMRQIKEFEIGERMERKKAENMGK